MSSPNAHEGAAPGSALPRSFSRYPGSIRSPKQTPTANSIFEDDETPLGSGIAGQLPRRNHTISSGTSRASTRRLPQHFEQPIPPTSPPAGPAGNSQSISSASPAGRLLKHHHPASPSRNSLQDILQGEDPAHEVEWEQALQDERRSADEQLAALPTQEAAASASSIRRHQSLNHHHKRSGSRLAASFGVSDLPMHHTIGPTSPVSLTSQLQSAFGTQGPARSATLGSASLAQASQASSAQISPVSPSSFSQAPWNTSNEGAEDVLGEVTSPSRFAHTFNPSRAPASQSSSPTKRLATGRTAFMSGDLMDIHSSLQRMDLQDGSSRPRIEFSSGETTTTNPGSNAHLRKLPTLITDPEALGHPKHGRTQSSFETSMALAGPMSAAPILGHNRQSSSGHGHSRVQSTDGVISGSKALPERHDDLNNSPPASLADIFGPHTAAPISDWTAKHNLAGMRSNGTIMSNVMSPPSDNRQHLIHRRNEGTPTPPPPSQWGMALSPTADRASREQHMLRLSMALAEKRQEAAALEAALQAGAAMDSMTTRSGQLHYPQTVHYNGPPPDLGPQRPQWHPGRPQEQAQASHPGRQAYPTSPLPPAQWSQGTPNLPSQATDGQPDANPEARLLIDRLGLNPSTFELSPPHSTRFLVIKSFTEDDVHRSIRHGIWASTDKGNQRLNRVYAQCQREAEERSEKPTVYLFFSVNGSGHFCGLAEMTSPVDFNTSSDVWAQEGKWKGTFQVKHIFVKDIPNRELRHIKLPNNPENKSVTQSRDTQELNREAGVEMLRIVHGYPAKTSLLQSLTNEPPRVGLPPGVGQQIPDSHLLGNSRGPSSNDPTFLLNPALVQQQPPESMRNVQNAYPFHVQDQSPARFPPRQDQYGPSGMGEAQMREPLPFKFPGNGRR